MATLRDLAISPIRIFHAPDAPSATIRAVAKRPTRANKLLHTQPTQTDFADPCSRTVVVEGTATSRRVVTGARGGPRA